MCCGPPVLFTEEFDTHQHQLRGNLPQAFVPAGMFEAAARLTRPWPAQAALA
jgi:alpha,alpha-trehalase